MRIKTVPHFLATAIAWLPLLLVLATITLLVVLGVMQFELNTYGTEYFLPNGSEPRINQD